MENIMENLQHETIHLASNGDFTILLGYLVLPDEKLRNVVRPMSFMSISPLLNLLTIKWDIL